MRGVLRVLRRGSRVGLGIVLVIAIFTGGFMLGSSRPALPALAQNAEPNGGALFKPFWEMWDLLHQNYVGTLDDNALMEAALNGMVNSLNDKYTNYFDPAFYKSYQDEVSGKFGGIGATIKKDDKTGSLIVVSTIVGTPARTAGLKAGDTLVQVDGKDITGLTQNQVVSRVRGEPGTSVALGILRDQKLITITIVRAEIVIPNVETRLYSGNIGYISLSEFGDHSSRDFVQGLRRLNANKLNGLIIDLRGNPGGYLTSAIEIASQFLPKGNVLIERGRAGEETFPVNGKPLAPTVPLIVLVDGGSASASELVSGALQDAGRARLLGVQTFGKGSVQVIEPLSNGGAAHITVARWYTPNGRTIQDVGLTPDILVPWDVEQYPDRDLQLEQAILALRGEL